MEGLQYTKVAPSVLGLVHPVWMKDTKNTPNSPFLQTVDINSIRNALQ